MNDNNDPDLIVIFRNLPDPRVKRTRLHNIEDILAIALCAMLCGAESFEDMEEFGEAKEVWLRRFLELPNGIPSHDTINRLFSALDPELFLGAFMEWTQSVRKAFGAEVVALDGKALCRALNAGEKASVVVGAWACSNALSLGQVQVDEKSNEITAIPKLLRVLELSGCIVSIDAMGCQKKIAREIVEADADYLLALKGNHPEVHAEVKSYLDDAIMRNSPGLDCHEEADKGHGRVEIRRCWQSVEVDWFAGLDEWAGLRSFVAVECERTQGGQTSLERRYFLSSLGLKAAEAARAVRSHWGIENKLHWVLDVVFNEDQSRARTKYAAQNLSALRRWAMNIFSTDDPQKKRSLKGRRKKAGWDNDYLLHLLQIKLDA